MLTNPNTLGLFERDIEAIADLVHDAGGLLYYDGANLNALLLGRARPGDMGFDVMHYNVHKTFATPHGGGGPGAGPIGVAERLEPYLPAPRVRGGRRGPPPERTSVRAVSEPRGKVGTFELFDPEHSLGKVHGFQGNWPVLLKAYAYIARLGDEGLADASAKAVLNANYLASQLSYDVPFGPFHHEFVASAGDQDAADVAKRMLDYGVHPPTTKWPDRAGGADDRTDRNREQAHARPDYRRRLRRRRGRGRRRARIRADADGRRPHRPGLGRTRAPALLAQTGRVTPARQATAFRMFSASVSYCSVPVPLAERTRSRTPCPASRRFRSRHGR